MPVQIRKILVATDLSENSRHAFRYAAFMADKFDARITILHVIDDLSTTGIRMLIDYVGEEKWAAIRKEREKGFRGNIRKNIEAFCGEISKEMHGCPFIVENTILREGNPAEEILAEAGKPQYDMVVMGTQGYGFVAGVFMGNTARRVVRRCKKPVTVIPLPETPPPPAE